MLVGSAELLEIFSILWRSRLMGRKHLISVMPSIAHSTAFRLNNISKNGEWMSFRPSRTSSLTPPFRLSFHPPHHIRPTHNSLHQQHTLKILCLTLQPCPANPLQRQAQQLHNPSQHHLLPNSSKNSIYCSFDVLI